MRLIKSLGTAAAVAALTIGLVGVASPASASDGSTQIDYTVSDQAVQTPTQNAEYDRLVANADALHAADTVVGSDRTFDLAKAIEGGAPEDLAASWAEGVAAAGGTVIKGGDRVSHSAISPAACRGESGHGSTVGAHTFA